MLAKLKGCDSLSCSNCTEKDETIEEKVKKLLVDHINKVDFHSAKEKIGDYYKPNTPVMNEFIAFGVELTKELRRELEREQSENLRLHGKCLEQQKEIEQFKKLKNAIKQSVEDVGLINIRARIMWILKAFKEESVVKCCQCGRECKNKDIAETSGWAWRETPDGLKWSCNDCAVENYIEKMEASK